MKLSTTFKVAALTLLLPAAAMAAPPAGVATAGNPQIGSPVTPHSIDVDLRNLPTAPQWKPGQAIREAHKRQFRPLDAANPHAPANKPTASDRLPELQQLWDESAPAASRSRVNTGRVSINNGNTGVSPGDPVVEVGTDHVIYGVNASTGTQFTIYNKAGTKLAGPTAFTTLAPAGHACKTSVSDPIVLFDRIANRWFLLEMGGSSTQPHLCTYVSKTSDPVSGGWWFYGFATPTTPDYPHCGVWNNAYVCGDNEGNAQVSVYAFDRANMLNGATARPAQRFASVNKLAGYGFQMLTPATFYGTNAAPAGTRQILARHNDDEAHAGTSADGTRDFIDLFSMNIDWTTPANSSITTLPRIPITEFNSWFRNYSSFATVPQPGSTSLLDPIREVILNQLMYRNMGTHEAIVGTFATNQNAARTGTTVDSGIRWFELRKSGTGNWALHQEGTFSPGDTSTHHLLGTIAMDKNGNIGLGYNVTKTTSPTKFASLGYTGRTASDAAGVMTLGENEVATGAAAETSGRWGDYYQMTVDPADDCTFWFVGMYRPTGSWNTRIADFKFNDCGTTGSTFAVSGTVTTSGGAGISGVTVSAGSTSATTNASGAYTLNLANGTYTLTPSLSGYTFSPTSRSVTVNGAAVTGQNFTGTATTPPPGNVLSNGVAVTGISGATGSQQFWTMDVPAGASNLKFVTSGGTGDGDLYVKFGSAPTTSSYDCRSWASGNTETCNITTAQAGTYHVLINAYSTFSGMSLTGSYTVGSTRTTYTNGTDVTISDNTTVESPITVSGRSGNAPSDTAVVVNIVHTYIGDLKVDLIAPDGSVYVLHNRTGTSTDNINKTYTVNLSTEALNGTWKLRVNDNAAGDVGRIDSWSITF